MAQNQSRKCDFCTHENKKTASLYCYECEQSLCIECKRDIHERVPIFEDHQLVDINTTGSRVFKPKPVCVSHMNNFIYYCSQCDCLACKDCLTSSHNGHTTDTIKHIVVIYRENAKQIQEKLKAKVEIVQVTLDTITTEQMRQIKSDYDSYVQKVEKTARELYGVVDHIKSNNITDVNDFREKEKNDLHTKLIFYQQHYEELSSALLQYESILNEWHDITFFTEWKRLQKDLDNIFEMDQSLKNPSRIASYNEESFITAVIEEIDKRFVVSILKDKDRKVHDLQKEIGDLTKVLKQKETEIEIFPHILKEKDRKVHELQKEVGEATKILKQKETEMENLSHILKKKDRKVHTLQKAVDEATKVMKQKEKEIENRPHILKEKDELQKEVGDLKKDLKQKESEIEYLPHVLKAKIRKVYELQKKVDDLTEVVKQKDTKLENNNRVLVEHDRTVAMLQRLLDDKTRVVNQMKANMENIPQCSWMKSDKEPRQQEEAQNKFLCTLY